MSAKTCCFIGHRETEETQQLKNRLEDIIEELIVNENTDTFLFGSKSRFNSICYELVTKKQEKRPHIKRVYVRAEFPDISGDYREYLLENYEETYFPAAARGAGRAVYVKRNCEMIEKSDICVFCLNESGAPKNRKSGTEIAFNYALKRKKQIIRLNG